MFQMRWLWLVPLSTVLSTVLGVGLFCYEIAQAERSQQLWRLSQRVSESNNKLLQVEENLKQFLQLAQTPKYQYLEIKTVHTTGYAPLDPDAVEGMCFAGNPKITASGRKTAPGITISASPEIPFGTWVWLDGLGWRRVDDRGSRIKGNRIDICFQTRKEALQWGKRTLIMVIPHLKGSDNM